MKFLEYLDIEIKEAVDQLAKLEKLFPPEHDGLSGWTESSCVLSSKAVLKTYEKIRKVYLVLEDE